LLGFRYGGFSGVPCGNHLLVQLDNPVSLFWGEVTAVFQRLGERCSAGTDGDRDGFT